MNLRCENICQKIGEKEILKDISLKTGEDKILVLMGPNGSGKTTLLKILGLLNYPSSGEIFHNDIKVTCRDIDARRRCAFVFQNPVLLDRTVLQNIIYGAKKRNIELKSKKIESVTGMLGIDHLLKRNAKTLSGGEKKRVMIAMAIMCEPQILILDEPFENLDLFSSRIIEDFILNLRDFKSTTILMSTHSLLQARIFGDAILILNRGQIVDETTKEDISLKNFDFLKNRGRNIFKVEIKKRENYSFAILPNGIEIPVLTRVEGIANIFIPPSNIVVLAEKDESKSGRCVKSRIVEIIKDDELMLVTMDAGFTLDTLIPRKSFDEMGLYPGKEVYLKFEEDSIEVFKEDNFEKEH